jgi:periplasmic protein TonB
MNAALNRPALNMTILVSVIFHLAVIYYLATSWQIIPPLMPEQPPEKRIDVVPPPIQPPVIRQEPEKQPIFNPKRVDTPVVSPVDPVPLPPQPTPNPDAARGPLIMNTPITEQPTSFVKPIYPARPLNDGREGHIVLSITILPDGSVTDVQVVFAQPPGLFEQSAVDAVRRWRYKPSNVTRTRVLIDIDYKLTD